jgi:hypothetical protein
MFATAKPQIESLESRDLLSADWFSAYLPNTNIANMARADWNNHSAITYNDMMGIYAQVEHDGRVDSSEFSSLQSLVTNAATLRTADSVRFLEAQVVGNNPANRVYQGYSLGNLAVNSSATQLKALVGKWFQGADHPAVNAGQGIGYAPWNGSVFSSSGPSYADVHQGGMGDCALLASFAETAARDSADISNMFTNDGNNVWTVRFFQNGSPVYVTVDNMLPSVGGRTFYAAPQGNLWVALAEKAYAELNAFDSVDGVASNMLGQNSYTALNGMDASRILPALTARQGYSTYNAATIGTGLSQGNLIVLGTGANSGSPSIVPDHAYAVLGYNASTRLFTLFNPWGVNGGTFNGHQVWGTFTATAQFLQTYFTDLGGWTRTAPGSKTDAGLALAEAGTENSTFAPVEKVHAAHLDSVFATFPTGAVESHDVAAVLSGHHRPAGDGADLLDQVFAS